MTHRRRRQSLTLSHVGWPAAITSFHLSLPPFLPPFHPPFLIRLGAYTSSQSPSPVSKPTMLRSTQAIILINRWERTCRCASRPKPLPSPLLHVEPRPTAVQEDQALSMRLGCTRPHSAVQYNNQGDEKRHAPLASAIDKSALSLRSAGTPPSPPS